MKSMILASTSPRRKELLMQAGYSFEILSPECEEPKLDLPPEETVEALAVLKCQAAAKQMKDGEKDGLIISADTIVTLDTQILGKPEDEEDAFRMLKALSGRSHMVYTAVSVLDLSTQQMHTFHEGTEVWFYPLSDQEIRAYIATKEPMDKAGAYGIQGRGALFVEKIYGDYFNVVGLPIAHLNQVLTTLL